MTELTQDEFEKSASNEADLEAVDFYLKECDDQTQLRLSVAMYSGAGNHDLDKITKDAEELRLRSIGTGSRLRQTLLLSMNQNTLFELAERLSEPDQLFEYSYISGKQDSLAELEQSDPVRGPVLAMIRHRKLLPTPPDIIEDEKMKDASSGTSLPCPDSPCELKIALRWAADAPDIPFKILNRAFFDWTTTIVDYVIPQTKFIEEYRSSFQPGKTKPSKNLVAHVKNLITSQLGDPQIVRFKSHLIFFATSFRPFWNKHGAAYMQLARKKSSKNAASGLGGPITTKKKDLQEKTDDFVRFCNGRIIPAIGSDEWDDFFAEFAKPMYKDPRTKKKIAAFMKTLLVRTTENLSDDEIGTVIKLLKVENYKAVDSDTIRSCMEKLKGIAVT